MLRSFLLVFISFSVLKSQSLQNCDCPHSQIQPTLSSTCKGSKFMKLIDEYINGQCDINDPCGRPTPRFIKTPDSSYDFIVVGSGSAGSVVASRLSENPEWKVLLIEAGEDEPTGTQIVGMGGNFQMTSIDWNFKALASTESDRILTSPRGKVLGGTSVLNGMMYLRGTKEDYDDWEALGNPGWSYENVLKHFKKSEDNADYDNEYHAKGGLQAVGKCTYTHPMIPDILEAAVESGLNINDLNAENSTGIMIAQFTQKNGIRRSSARSFLRPARDRSNLHILVNSTVTKVLLQNKVTIGVEASSNTGQVFKIKVSKEVILSAGAIGSPQILLLSGVGPSEDLNEVGVEVEHNLPGVGRNVQDHVSYGVNFRMNQSDVNSLNWLSLKEYMVNRSGPLSSRDLMVATAKIASPYSNGRSDIQFYFFSSIAACSKTGIPGELNSAKQKSFKPTPVMLRPKSRGYITLKSSDPFEHPKIVYNVLQDPQDLEILLHGVKFALTLGKAKALEKYNLTLDQDVPEGCENFEFGSDDFWRCAIKAAYSNDNHQAGSCKMGPSSDRMAVVDPRLKVYGIKGLRVIDSSIMPKVIAGNTHATIMMIGEMGSQFVKEDWEE
ncbi:Gld.2 family protein [Megaselia abdita]